MNSIPTRFRPQKRRTDERHGYPLPLRKKRRSEMHIPHPLMITRSNLDTIENNNNLQQGYDSLAVHRMESNDCQEMRIKLYKHICAIRKKQAERSGVSDEDDDDYEKECSETDIMVYAWILQTQSLRELEKNHDQIQISDSYQRSDEVQVGSSGVPPNFAKANSNDEEILQRIRFLPF